MKMSIETSVPALRSTWCWRRDRGWRKSARGQEKAGVLVVCLILLGIGMQGTLGAEDLSSAVPQAYPPDRYAALLDKSPFAVATAAPEPVAPVENFATNLYVSAIFKSYDDEGKPRYRVLVRSRDEQLRLDLFGDKPSEDGIALVAVDEAAISSKSTVTLKKGSETGRIEFDQAAPVAGTSQVPQPAPGNAGAPRPGAGTASPNPGNVARRPAANQSTIPRPGMSAQPRAVPTPGQKPGVAPGAQQRVRSVQEPP